LGWRWLVLGLFRLVSGLGLVRGLGWSIRGCLGRTVNLFLGGFISGLLRSLILRCFGLLGHIVAGLGGLVSGLLWGLISGLLGSVIRGLFGGVVSWWLWWVISWLRWVVSWLWWVVGRFRRIVSRLG